MRSILYDYPRICLSVNFREKKTIPNFGELEQAEHFIPKENILNSFQNIPLFMSSHQS